MDVRRHADPKERRAPDWPAAAVSGFAAGAVLMVVDLLWSILVTGGNPWITSHQIAAIWTGPDTVRGSTFNVGVVALALATHYALGLVFGLVLVALMAGFRLGPSLGAALLTGAALSVAVYVFNFYGLVRVVPWFTEMRGSATLVAHLIFGMSAALIYWKLERRGEGRA